MNKMKLIENMANLNSYNSIIVLFYLLLFLSCETNFDYQKLEIDAPNNEIRLLSDEFVVDSIILKNYERYFYQAYLENKEKGEKLFKIGSDNPNYRVEINNLEDICNDKYDNKFQEFKVFIRKKGCLSKNIYDREVFQEFIYGRFPCFDSIILLTAEKRK